MSFQEGIMHAFHLGVVCQELGDTQCIFILPLNADGKALDPAQEQPCSVRIHYSTESGACFVHFVDQILPARENSAKHVRVTSEILGTGVHHPTADNHKSTQI